MARMLRHLTQAGARYIRTPVKVWFLTHLLRQALLTVIEADEGICQHEHPRTFVQPLESTVERIDDAPASEAIHTVDKEKSPEVDRGRTLERGPKYPNPLAKAESRPRKNDLTIELDVQPIEKRQLSRSSTFSNFEDPNDPCAAFEDDLLEPCPRLEIRNSVSEVLGNSNHSIDPPSRIIHSSTWSVFDKPRVDHPRPRTFTTVFSDCRPVHPSPTLPPESLPKLRPDIDQLENIAITTSTPLWSTSETSPHIRADSLNTASSPASQLPTEIVQQIFYNLAPVDFNSARHTCRSWLIKSLNRSLLETMLKRAGFSNRIVASEPNPLTFGRISPEWSMSKSLALESALGPYWTGNGLARNDSLEPLTSAFLKVIIMFFGCPCFKFLAF